MPSGSSRRARVNRRAGGSGADRRPPVECPAPGQGSPWVRPPARTPDCSNETNGRRGGWPGGLLGGAAWRDDDRQGPLFNSCRQPATWVAATRRRSWRACSKIGSRTRNRPCCGPWAAADCRGSPNVCLPLPIAAFRAHGRLRQLSAINRHNQRLFDDLGGAQHYRWGYRKTERLSGLEVDEPPDPQDRMPRSLPMISPLE